MHYLLIHAVLWVAGLIYFVISFFCDIWLQCMLYKRSRRSGEKQYQRITAFMQRLLMFVCPAAILYYLNWYFFISTARSFMIYFYQYFIHILLYLVIVVVLMVLVGYFWQRKLAARKRIDSLPVITNHDEVKYLFEQPLMRSSFVWGISDEPTMTNSRAGMLVPDISMTGVTEEQISPAEIPSSYKVLATSHGRKEEKPVEPSDIQLTLSFHETPVGHATVNWVNEDSEETIWEKLGLPNITIVEDEQENLRILRSWYGIPEPQTNERSNVKDVT
jgi:uncharacterized membrane protein